MVGQPDIRRKVIDMLDFNTAVGLFKNDSIRELSATDEGMRFLKLRSFSRKAHLEYLINKFGIEIGNSKSREWLKCVYESDIRSADINISIQEFFEKEREIRRENEQQLINELYKVQSFDWGGLHQGSLETTIVNRYVKKIISYESLCNAIEEDLHSRMRAYVLASWYNHWTSIIIEDIFKEHVNVIPAVGLIKKIDFFVSNKPFDLKVTYLPEGYIKDYRKANGLRPELTLMKSLAKKLNIGFDASVPESILIPDLWRKLDDNPNRSARELIHDLKASRETLLDVSISDPEPLVRWFYENQGVRRFDASNRLFLVLVDRRDFFDSWKLKRAKPLISKYVINYLDEVDQNIGLEFDFLWEGETYTAEADVIFVVK